MDESRAQNIVTISSLIVGGLYVYRAASEGEAKRQLVSGSRKGSNAKEIGEGVLGLSGEPVPMGTFMTGWGITYIAVSIMVVADPDFGALFAILIAVTAILLQGARVTGALKKGVFSKIGQGKHPSEALEKGEGLGAPGEEVPEQQFHVPPFRYGGEVGGTPGTTPEREHPGGVPYAPPREEGPFAPFPGTGPFAKAPGSNIVTWASLRREILEHRLTPQQVRAEINRINRGE